MARNTSCFRYHGCMAKQIQVVMRTLSLVQYLAESPSQNNLANVSLCNVLHFTTLAYGWVE